MKSAEFDLKLGDRVLAINGIPIKVALDNVENSVEELSLTVLRDKTKITVKLPRTIEVMDSAKKVVAPVSGATLLKAMVLPDQIGYLRVDAFMGTQMGALIDQAMLPRILC